LHKVRNDGRFLRAGEPGYNGYAKQSRPKAAMKKGEGMCEC
jgi:hypothetical protein